MDSDIGIGNDMMSEPKKIAEKIIEQIEGSIKLVDEKQIEDMVQLIMDSKKIFVAGSGRSGFVARSFASRIVDLGYEVYVVGETITPSAKSLDTIIAISGSGETSYTLNAAEVGKKLGAKIIAITSYPESPLARLGDVVVHMPGRITGPVQASIKDYLTRQITGIHEPFTPAGTAFELACMVLLESVVITIKERREGIEGNYESVRAAVKVN